jgi:hypothetical protein
MDAHDSLESGHEGRPGFRNRGREGCPEMAATQVPPGRPTPLRMCEADCSVAPVPQGNGTCPLPGGTACSGGVLAASLAPMDRS